MRSRTAVPIGMRRIIVGRTRYDPVGIGGGHNGLTAAAYLARAGRKVLVLERRHLVGGAAVTEEVFPGLRSGALAAKAILRSMKRKRS